MHNTCMYYDHSKCSMLIAGGFVWPQASQWYVLEQIEKKTDLLNITKSSSYALGGTVGPDWGWVLSEEI